jgi:outer membrane lipoprotein-sorting protein
VALSLFAPACVAAAPTASGARQPLARFAARLAAAGRAEVVVTRTAVDPLSDRPVTARGRLAIEPPDRLAVGFDGSGERLTLRGDGGEWLQPALRQMLTLGGERAAAAARAWRVLLGETGEDAPRLVPLGARRYRVTFPAEQLAPDSVVLTLDARGFPRRLEFDDGAGKNSVAFSNWTFGRARGRAAFVIKPPAGYEVIPLP